MKQKIGFLVVILLSIFFTAIPTLVQEEGSSPQSNCTNVTTNSLGLNNAQITSVSLVVTDIEYPAYCLVRGIVDERTGIDGKQYAVNFEMRLPSAWNGRFMYQQNGGNDGSVVPAIAGGNATDGVSALARGFAVLSSDAGHNGADPINAEAGLAAGNIFGLDPEARSYYGYAATAALVPVADAIIEGFYGIQAEYSYMMGCSNGGRHAMVTASRYGDLFDGILAGDPGFNLPRAAVQHAWDVQSFQIANPNIIESFSREDMSLVAASVIEACDALDGVADGLVANMSGCQSAFDLSTLQCADDSSSSCLTAEQVTALSQSMAGPTNSDGEQLYSDWSYDSGMGAGDWRFWKLESGIPPWGGLPLIATLGAGSLSYIFTTPPTETAGDPMSLVQFLTDFDFDTDAPKIYATDDVFVESAMEFMTPPDVDNPMLTDLYESGGKMIIYHGQSDGVFSVNDTINWYEMLSANYEGSADEFVRLFTIPGMNHCSGGPTTDQFDALTALMNWVEGDAAPDQIIAAVNPANPELPMDWSPTRTRPLCPYPMIATYQEGDIESAASFVCEVPE